MRKICVALLCALAISGCVNTKTSALDARTAVISGRGSAFHDIHAIWKNLMREAAEQTLANGYTHFAILNTTNQTTQSYYRAPTQTHHSGYVSDSGYYSGNSYTTGGQVYNFVKPGADVIVRFYHANEIEGAEVWEAESVLAAADK